MNPLAISSIVISVVSLVFAVSVHLRADTLADEALRRREKQLVESLKPKVLRVYEDFDTAFSPSEANPETLDELFAPMLRLVTSVSSDR